MSRRRPDKITVYLPKDLSKRIKQILKDEKRSFADLIEQLIEEDWERYWKSVGEEPPPIEELEKDYGPHIRNGKHRNCRSTKRL